MALKKQLKVCVLSTMYLRHKNDTRGLMIYELNRSLIKNGIAVEVVAPNDEGCKNFEVMEGVNVHRFNYFWPKSLQRLAYGSGIPTNLRTSFFAKLQVPFFAFSFLLKAIKVSRKCALVHAQWIATGLIGILSRIFTGKKVVVTVRQIVNRGIIGKINKFVLNNADFVIFNSSYTMNESLKISAPKKHKLIWNSIDSEKFKKFSVQKLRKELGIGNKKVIFSMGLLVEKKGFSYLINAMPDVLKDDKEVVLIIAGSGKEEKSLKTIVSKLALEKNVIFTGTVDGQKTPEFYNLCDIFVLPSIVDSKGETETLGVVLLEAMACEKPVIGSNVGGIPDIIDNKVGFLTEQKNSKQLSSKILYLLKNEKLRERLGKAGRKKVLNKFSSTHAANNIIKVYNSILGRQ